MKLVAYFSATGTTKTAAEKVAAEMGADIFEIAPEVAYTKEDLNWMDKTSRSSVEMADKSIRPQMNGKTVDISKYDEEGLLYYVSRKDFQIKYRGGGIGVKDIEAQIMKEEGVILQERQ